MEYCFFEKARPIFLKDKSTSQRHFGEVWDFRNGDTLSENDRKPIEILNLPIQILPRISPYPHYEDTFAQDIATFGTLTYDETLPYRASAYSVNPMPEIFEINAFIGAYLRLEALLAIKKAMQGLSNQ